jgi:hypothetical protein
MYAKGIDDIEMCDPPGGLSSDEFKKINPSGKIPALFVAVSVLPAFGIAEPLAATPTLARYWQAIQEDEYCGRVLAEMTTALKARMGGA